MGGTLTYYIKDSVAVAVILTGVPPQAKDPLETLQPEVFDHWVDRLRDAVTAHSAVNRQFYTIIHSDIVTVTKQGQAQLAVRVVVLAQNVKSSAATYAFRQAGEELELSFAVVDERVDVDDPEVAGLVRERMPH